MSTLREAAQQALEALGCIEYGINGIEYGPSDDTTESAITALRAALAQQEQEPTVRYKCTVVDNYHPNGVPFEQWVNAPQEEPEPVAPYAWMAVGGTIWRRKTSEDDVPLYTRPPRREWHGLKEWEINDGRDQLPTEDLCNWSFRQGVYFAEKALKERNNG
jgi:hypothetical protein